MHLAIVTHKLVPGDGQGRVNYEVAREVLRRGHQVTLVASEVDEDLAHQPGATWLRIDVDRWPTELLRNQVFACRSAQFLRAHQEAFDLVKANGAITWAPAGVNAVHFVHSAWLECDVHTARVQSGPYGWYQWLYTVLNARWERQAFEKARVLVAVSTTVRDQMISAGAEADKIRVIPNGVDLDEFRPMHVGHTFPDAWPVPPGHPAALFAGDIRTPRKNLDTVLRALPRVNALHLVVAGSIEGSPYPDLAQQLGVGGRVHFLGFRKDLPALMRAADLCVAPSRYEPFSLVVLEAMASGLPVVTARPVGAADLVTIESGLVVDDPEDVRALADALATLAGDRQRRQAMGRAARCVAEQHSFRQMAAAYADLFEAMNASGPEQYKAAARSLASIGVRK